MLKFASLSQGLLDSADSRRMGDLPPGVFRVCGKYRLRKKIGSGSFGEFLCFLYL